MLLHCRIEQAIQFFLGEMRADDGAIPLGQGFERFDGAPIAGHTGAIEPIRGFAFVGRYSSQAPEKIQARRTAGRVRSQCAATASRRLGRDGAGRQRDHRRLRSQNVTLTKKLSKFDNPCLLSYISIFGTLFEIIDCDFKRT